MRWESPWDVGVHGMWESKGCRSPWDVRCCKGKEEEESGHEKGIKTRLVASEEVRLLREGERELWCPGGRQHQGQEAAIERRKKKNRNVWIGNRVFIRRW